MASNKELKAQVVEEIKGKLQKAKSVVFVNYSGLTVDKESKFRAKFRDAKAEYKVYKNRLVMKALDELNIAGLNDKLNGTCSVAFSYDDETAGPRISKDMLKDVESMKAVGFIYNNKVSDLNTLDTLATLPSKDVLISKLLYLLKAPVRNLAVVLNESAKKNA
jgi:large subunit ribosomal protein L10